MKEQLNIALFSYALKIIGIKNSIVTITENKNLNRKGLES